MREKKSSINWDRIQNGDPNNLAHVLLGLIIGYVLGVIMSYYIWVLTS